MLLRMLLHAEDMHIVYSYIPYYSCSVGGLIYNLTSCMLSLVVLTYSISFFK